MLQQLDFGGSDLFAVSLRCLAPLLKNDCSKQVRLFSAYFTIYNLYKDFFPQVLNIVLNFCQRLTDLLTDPVEMKQCLENAVFGMNADTLNDIKLALVECMKPLALICSGLGSVKNHEYLWLVCYIAQRDEFCSTGGLSLYYYLFT